MALVNQYQAENGGTSRQGNANFVLYALAKKSGASCASSATEAAGCVFNDVTKGNSDLPTGVAGVGTNSVPCTGGSPNCSVLAAGNNGVLVEPTSATTEAWTVTAGYDTVTGLGSVNANNLVTLWGTVSTVPTTTTLTLAPTTGITHGTAENVTVNVTVTPSTGTASGDVSLIAKFADGTTQGLNQFTLASGKVVNGTTNSLPGGTGYTVTAHYAGDGTNAPSDSAPVTVTVGQESSQTFPNMVTFDFNGNPTSFTATSVTYGSGYAIFRVDVGDAAASVSSSGGIASNCSKKLTTCPTGVVAITSTGTSLGASSMALNILGYAETAPLPPGTYSVAASYPGDASYGPSTGNANFAIAKAPTTVTAEASGLPVPYGDYDQIIVVLTTTSEGIAPTGTFQFQLDGTPLGGPLPVSESGGYAPGGTPPNYAWANASSSTAFLSVGNHTLAAQYSGDANYAAATSAAEVVPVAKALPAFNSYGAIPSTVNVNQPVTLTAQLFGSAAGVAPTGTVTFYVGKNAVSGTVTYTPVNSGPISGSALLSSISYTPTIAGAYNITMTYSGDANYLPAGALPVPAVLTVVGPDFTIAAQGSTALTVFAGQTATFSNAIGVTGTDGFASAVALSCIPPAMATTCAVTPASSPSGSGTASVTVTTMSRSMLPPISPWPRRIGWPIPVSLALSCLLVLLLTMQSRRGRLLQFAGSIFLAIFALVLLAQSTGCGGGGGGSVTPPPPQGTPAGIYSITVTGTSGSITHTGTLQLTVE